MGGCAEGEDAEKEEVGRGVRELDSTRFCGG